MGWDDTRSKFAIRNSPFTIISPYAHTFSHCPLLAER